MAWKAIQKCAKVITWLKIAIYVAVPSDFYLFCIHIIFVYTLTCISLSICVYVCVHSIRKISVVCWAAKNGSRL